MREDPHVLHLPKLQDHQRDVLDNLAPYKLWRAGRRSGKSTGSLVAAVDGHGPRDPRTRRPLHIGMLQGGRIAWLAKTYKQSKAIWRRLLKRFRPLEGTVVKIDREDKRIELLDETGSLAVWSGHTRDAIDNLRGDFYDGIIFDEGAYIDLQYAIDEVALPALLDRGGWIIIPSTPNAGWDKNEERIAPSYFNRLCQDILDGRKGPDWKQWHHVPEDNKRLSAEGLRKLRAQYPADSATAQQELDALLVAGGLLALKIDRNKVLVEPRALLPHWSFFAAIDWGYGHPFSFGLYAVTEGGLVIRVDGVSGRQLVPPQIAEACKRVLERWFGPDHANVFRCVRYTIAGGDVMDEVKARGHTGPTIQEQWARMGWAVIRAQTARVMGLNNMRLYFANERFVVFDTPNNREFLTCLETRITDPLDPEDVFKQDADANGRGGDDPYDEGRYALMSRPIVPKAPPVEKSKGQAPSLAELTGRVPASGAQVMQPNFRPSVGPQTRQPSFRPGIVKR